MIKTYLVPVSEEVVKLMEKGEAPSFLHCATCLDGLTNGEVIQALFPNIDNNFSNVLDLRLWWGRPYKAESPETCKGCLEPCIMYEPDMRGCKKKVTEKGGE